MVIRPIPQHFNPLARMGRDALFEFGGNGLSISIHSPAKGETEKVLDFAKEQLISIHSPAKGETSFRDFYKVSKTDFNPLAHERRD